MQNDGHCQGCKQLHQCRETYRQLGGVRSPSVARKVVLAFLAPMLVFIASLALFQEILAGAAMAGQVRTAAGLAAALAAAFICVLVTRAIEKRIGEKQQHRDA
jgi:hypothetical protein